MRFHDEAEKDTLCLQCRKPFHGGRTDRRFCNDQCRNTYNREKRRLAALDAYEDAHERIIRSIKKNHALLKKFNPRQEGWIVDWEPLYRAGFRREFFTGCETLPNGNIRYYCFEQGWLDLGEAKIELSVDLERLEIADDLAGENLEISQRI